MRPETRMNTGVVEQKIAVFRRQLSNPGATDLIDGDLRFFGLQCPGPNLEGCAMHQCLLKQYEKAHPVAVDA